MKTITPQQQQEKRARRQQRRIEALRLAMRKDVELLRKIIHSKPKTVKS